MPGFGTPRKTSQPSAERKPSNNTGGGRSARKTARKSSRGRAKFFTFGSRKSSFLPLLAVWMLAVVVLGGLIYWGESSRKHFSKPNAGPLTSPAAIAKRSPSLEERKEELNKAHSDRSEMSSSQANLLPHKDEPSQRLKPPKPKTHEKEQTPTPTQSPTLENTPSDSLAKPAEEERTPLPLKSNPSTFSIPSKPTHEERLAASETGPIVKDLKSKNSGSNPPPKLSSLNLNDESSLPPFKNIQPSHGSPPPEGISKSQIDVSQTPKESYALALNRSGTEAVPSVKPPGPPPTSIAPTVAKVAIVIDDFGQDLEMAKKFLEIPLPIAFSVLPYLRHSREIAQLAHDHHHEVLLHLPMEPQGYPKTNPGTGALLLTMSQKTIQETLESALDSSPYSVGVNNHMGSRFTEDAHSMSILLKELRQRHLYFLDSYTSPKSVGMTMAREFQVPTGRRDIFLDHETKAEFIRSQIQQLIRKARIQGAAIAIGHPHDTTLQVLRENAGLFHESGIAVVPPKQLMGAPPVEAGR